MNSRNKLFPSLFLSNIQSLCSKLDELLVFANSAKPDIIALTESWTNDKISDQQIMIPGYSNPYRHDRSDGRKGGGVCCYVKKEIPAFLIDIPFDCPTQIENVWLRFPSLKLILAVLYVPPNLKSEDYEQIVDFIMKMCDWSTNAAGNDHPILAGDFNELPTSDFENVLGLTQLVKEPTRGRAILDKVFTDSVLATTYSEPFIGPNFGKADHKSVMIKSKSHFLHTSKYVKLYDYRQSFMDNFLAKLASKPWHYLYSLNCDVQTKCDLFYEWFEECKKEIPYSFVEMKSTDKPWITPLLKRLINLKHEAFRRKQFHLFAHYQSKLKNEIFHAKASWVKRQKQSPRRIWNIVRSITNKDPQTNNDLTSIVSQFPSTTHAADAINDKFVEVFANPPNWNTIRACLTEDDEWIVDTSVRTIYSELQKLNIKKWCGSDGISPRLLKAGAFVLAEPLAHLFSLSIQEGSVPVQWKSADVVPLPKSSTISLENLRPISLLPIIIISKILEKRVLESVKDSLVSSYGLNQFGFRPNSSTLYAMISLTDFITSQLDLATNTGVAVVSFDMSRAFDRLPHDQLFNSLLRSNLPHSFLRWLTHYFQDRRQKVILRGVICSSFQEITSGKVQFFLLICLHVIWAL